MIGCLEGGGSGGAGGIRGREEEGVVGAVVLGISIQRLGGRGSREQLRASGQVKLNLRSTGRHFART